DGGTAWGPVGSVSSTSHAVASLLFGNGDPGTLYAAGGYDLLTDLDYGYGVGWSLILQKSTDLGVTWTDLAGSFPPEDRLYVKDLVAGSSAHELFAAMGNAAPDRRLAHSTDGGATWDRAYLGSLPESVDLNRLAVDPARPGTLYAATSEGVFRSIDDG